jgi:hypothetical protein
MKISLRLRGERREAASGYTYWFLLLHLVCPLSGVLGNVPKLHKITPSIALTAH